MAKNFVEAFEDLELKHRIKKEKYICAFSSSKSSHIYNSKVLKLTEKIYIFMSKYKCTRYRIFFYIPGVELRGVLCKDLLLFGLGKELHEAEGPILDVLDNDDTNGIIAFLI